VKSDAAWLYVEDGGKVHKVKYHAVSVWEAHALSTAYSAPNNRPLLPQKIEEAIRHEHSAHYCCS
jgi:hypothetical protein